MELNLPVLRAGGGDGFADAWKRDFFAWEDKAKYRDPKATPFRRAPPRR